MVDEIKNAVNKRCKGNVVSCSDILAVAARDSVQIVSVCLLCFGLKFSNINSPFFV